MASKQTEHYGLSQWEATDQVVRLDFNSDNAKIDAGIKAAQDAADSAQALAGAAYTPENSPFVVGSYVGNGTASRTISLGFTPKAVLLVAGSGETMTRSTGYDAYYGGLITAGKKITCFSGTVLCIVENGFQVGYANNSDIICCSNENGSTYYYLALK